MSTPQDPPYPIAPPFPPPVPDEENPPPVPLPSFFAREDLKNRLTPPFP
jgi:hypothetical protein